MSKCCPYCKSKQRNRIKRPTLLKKMPFTTMYSCMKCSGHYVFNSFLHVTFKFNSPPVKKELS